MATQIPIYGHELSALLGTQVANSVTYGNVSLITADRNIKFNTDWTVTNVIDPASQATPATPVSFAAAKSVEIGGSGLFDKATGQEWLGWAANCAIRPVKLDGPVFTLTTNAVCTMEVTGTREEALEAKVTIQSSGPYVLTMKA